MASRQHRTGLARNSASNPFPRTFKSLLLSPHVSRHLVSGSPYKRPFFQPLPGTLRSLHGGIQAASPGSEARKPLEGNHMRKLLTCLSSILLAVLPLLAEVANASDQTKDDDRLRNCGTVLKEILDVPNNIPQDLLDKADCVVVFPSVLKAPFIFGA